MQDTPDAEKGLEGRFGTRTYLSATRAHMHDDLRWNKLFGAVLATGLAILMLREGTAMVFAPPAKPPAKPGYAVTIQEAAAEGGGDAAPDSPPDWGTVLASADVAAGQATSAKCQSCHNFANGGPNQTGPNLWGVIGRKPGSHPGFAYSAGMTDFGAKTPVWDLDHVYMFLGGPQAYISGTKMSFVGIKKPEDRVNLIAWLRQQSSSPVPIPAPDPKKAAAAPAAAGSAPAPAAAVSGAAGDATTPSAAAPGSPAGDTTASTAGVAAAAPSQETSNPGSGGIGGTVGKGRKPG